MRDDARIGLGTVQFGLPYGISNTAGQTPPDEAARILEHARNVGITVIDTASAYGTAEEVLGKLNLTGFRIISKFMPPENGSGISAQLERSLSHLKTGSLYGYLAHRPAEVVANPWQWHEATRLKEQGLIQKIGFSFNDPAEVDMVLEMGWLPDLTQVPFNYFDQRFKKHGILLHNKGCEVHSRSAFLQGLFFKQNGELPAFFDVVKPLLRTLQKNRDTLAGGLLAYCLKQEFIDYVIVGVNNEHQLAENLRLLRQAESLPELQLNIPENIVNPSAWPQS